MNKKSKIYIAGHAGLVGGALHRKLKALGYENLLTRTHQELDLTHKKMVEVFFQENQPEYVFLAAAKVGGIMANNEDRVTFLQTNLEIQNNVISSSYRHGVTKLLFFASSCVYPKNCPQPISESSLLTSPLEYTNEPYAIAKIAGLKLCESYNIQYRTNYLTLMPSNLYGPGDNYDLDSCHVMPSLMKKCVIAKLISDGEVEKAMQAAEKSDKESFHQFLTDYQITKDHITVWGTGKPRREFLHSEDLADASLFVMKNLNFDDVTTGIDELRNTHLNVGYGSDISIEELAQVIKDMVGYSGAIRFDTSKPDGAHQKLLDSSKLNYRGWKPKIELKAGIRRILSEKF